ncbi:hypothetical protein IM538_11895 [Cytobacillus suaedae]|nr:hypothetical protein IM538_11895 [Cytobacillus suaedae]
MKRYNEDSIIDETFTRLQKINLGEEEQREVHVKMMNSLEKAKSRKKRWDVRPVLSTVLAGILFIAGGYYFASETIFTENVQQGQLNQEFDSPYIELEHEISDLLQTSVFIPYKEGLPVKMALVHFDSSGGDGVATTRTPSGATIAYSPLKLTKMDNERIERLKEDHKLLYGDYIQEDKNTHWLTILSEEVTHIDSRTKALFGKEKLIAGHSVYQKVYEEPNVGEVNRISFKLDKTIYEFHFPTEHFTEGYAILFVEESIKQITNR